MIYFDNAATTLMKPPEVAEAVARAINTFGGVGRGVHEASLAASMAVFEAREQIAELFNAPSAARVSFTLNATEALNIAISGLLHEGDHAITTAASHNSMLRPLYAQQKRGRDLSVATVSPQGVIDYDELESLFKHNTKMVAVTHASNLTGDVYDLKRIAALCKKQGAIFVVDAAQTAGVIPLDMAEFGLDVLVFTGHKSLYGPQGTGGLCVAEGIDIPPFTVGGSGTHSFDHEHPIRMPESLEAGTLNAHGIAGLLAGLRYVQQEGVANIAHKTQELTEYFELGVRNIEGATLYGGHADVDRCGIVALNLGDIDSALVSDVLSTEYGIATRAGAHCAPLMHEALGTVDQGVVRFSFTPFNTLAEIDEGLRALREINESFHREKNCDD